MAEKKKSKSRVNEAGNYTKPALRRGCLTQSRLVEKAVSLVSGLRVKRRCWLSVIKKPVAAIKTNGSQEIPEVPQEVDEARLGHQVRQTVYTRKEGDR